MISRDTAAAIVPLLETALDHLLKAHTLVEGESSQHWAVQEMESLWLPTANVAGMLAVMNEAYADLAGPDVAFRERSVQDAARAGGALDPKRIRFELSSALDQLERTVSALATANEIKQTEEHRFRTRLLESVTALRPVVERLAAR